VTNIDFISPPRPQIRWCCSTTWVCDDPEEGAALAVAIAEHFRQVGA